MNLCISVIMLHIFCLCQSQVRSPYYRPIGDEDTNGLPAGNSAPTPVINPYFRQPDPPQPPSPAPAPGLTFIGNPTSVTANNSTMSATQPTQNILSTNTLESTPPTSRVPLTEITDSTDSSQPNDDPVSSRSPYFLKLNTPNPSVINQGVLPEFIVTSQPENISFSTPISTSDPDPLNNITENTTKTTKYAYSSGGSTDTNGPNSYTSKIGASTILLRNGKISSSTITPSASTAAGSKLLQSPITENVTDSTSVGGIETTVFPGSTVSLDQSSNNITKQIREKFGLNFLSLLEQGTDIEPNALVPYFSQDFMVVDDGVMYRNETALIWLSSLTPYSASYRLHTIMQIQPNQDLYQLIGYYSWDDPDLPDTIGTLDWCGTFTALVIKESGDYRIRFMTIGNVQVNGNEDQVCFVTRDPPEP